MRNPLEKWYGDLGNALFQKRTSPRKGEPLQGLDEVITTAKSEPSEKEEIIRAFMMKLGEKQGKQMYSIDWVWDFRGEVVYSSATYPGNVPRHSMDEGEMQAFQQGVLYGYDHADRIFREVAMKGQKVSMSPYVLRMNWMEGLLTNTTGRKHD